MEMVKKLAEMALEEADGACHYAKWAVMHKEDNPTFAKTLFEISGQELAHMDALNAEAVKELEQCRQEQPEKAISAGAVYAYIHEKMVDKAGKAKAYQMQYKGG